MWSSAENHPRVCCRCRCVRSSKRWRSRWPWTSQFGRGCWKTWPTWRRETTDRPAATDENRFHKLFYRMNSERSGRGLTHEAHNRRWRGNTVLGSGKKWRLLCNVSTGAGRMKLVAEWWWTTTEKYLNLLSASVKGNCNKDRHEQHSCRKTCWWIRFISVKWERAKIFRILHHWIVSGFFWMFGEHKINLIVQIFLAVHSHLLTLTMFEHGQSCTTTAAAKAASFFFASRRPNK